MTQSLLTPTLLAPKASRSLALSQFSLMRRLKVWLRYRRNLREVAGLDDRTLRDIGANRADLHRDAWSDACGERCSRGGW